MRRPDGAAPSPLASRMRLLGWLFAINALAVLAAVAGAGPTSAEAAHRLAAWCGIG